MDKRYQVFVSSTFIDLEEERKHIIQTLMEMDCIPAGMELFPAADEEQWDFIKKVIDDCDYYLLLIGGRYGSLSPAGISYTEMEYDYAVSKGMKVIALVHGEPNNLPQIKCEKDSALQEKLEKFREKVCTGRLVKFWTSKDQVAGIVALSLTKTIKMHPAIGWVRSNLIPSEDTTQEILKLRDQIKCFEEQIYKLKSKPEGVENLAQGEDTITITLKIRADTTNNFNQHFDIPINVTWNQLFKFISTLLVVECTQNRIVEFIPEILRHLGEETIKEFEENNNISNIRSFSTYINHTNLILVQLKALKLITLSSRKHPMSDNNIYWSLTLWVTDLFCTKSFAGCCGIGWDRVG